VENASEFWKVTYGPILTGRQPARQSFLQPTFTVTKPSHYPTSGAKEDTFAPIPQKLTIIICRQFPESVKQLTKI